MDPQRPMPIAVIGSGTATERVGSLAFEVGRELARAGALLVCGGRSGVMEQAAGGAKQEGGATVGILPGRDGRESAPNQHIDTVLFTGLGQARNQIVVLSARAVIAVGGGWGTVSEIALALKHRIPVILLESVRIELPGGEGEPLLFQAESARRAAAVALEQAGRRP